MLKFTRAPHLFGAAHAELPAAPSLVLGAPATLVSFDSKTAVVGMRGIDLVIDHVARARHGHWHVHVSKSSDVVMPKVDKLTSHPFFELPT